MFQALTLAAVARLALAHGPEGYRDLTRHRPSRDGHLSEEMSSISTMFLNYTIDGSVFEGYLAYPTMKAGELPGLMIVHQWYGLGENEMFRAEQAAEHGYAAFAVDMYGFGLRATNNGEAAALSGGVVGDPELLAMRASAGLAQLQPGGAIYDMLPINQSALVANGYCFGGYVCLAFAGIEEGSALAGTAVFHPTFPNLTDFANSEVAVQFHHGQLDFSGDDALYTAQNQLTAAGVTVWETAYYAGAAHGFSDILSNAFLERVAVQSHESMFSFYDGILQLPECLDSVEWFKNGETSKDCAWVAAHPPRCEVIGFPSGIRTMAMEACPVACGMC